MNKNTTLIVIIIIIVLIAVGWFAMSNDEPKDVNLVDDEDAVVDDTGDDLTLGDDAPDIVPPADDLGDLGVNGETMAGSYEGYSPEKLALAETGSVVLFFRASWCPTCRALDADIKANSGTIPAGVTILDVDYDNSTALRQEYGVTLQHTLVQVDKDGNQIAKWGNSPSLADLLGNLR